MSKHIKFDGFDCDALVYLKSAKQWICMDFFTDLDDVETCFKCKFAKQRLKEKLIREGKLNV